MNIMKNSLYGIPFIVSVILIKLINITLLPDFFDNIIKHENVIEINDHKTDDVSRVLLRYHVLEVGGAGKLFSLFHPISCS